MGYRRTLLAALAVGALLGGQTATLAQQGTAIITPPPSRAPKPVALSQVPPAARDAAERVLGTSNFSDVTERRGDWWDHFRDEELYDFRAQDAAGGRRSVTVDQDGHVVANDRRGRGDGWR